MGSRDPPCHGEFGSRTELWEKQVAHLRCQLRCSDPVSGTGLGHGDVVARQQAGWVSQQLYLCP